MQQTIIAHFDLDAFFVNVELLLHPEFKGKPIIVGGDGNRGIVSTCSYEARAFGVHSAMPMATAKKLCPQAIVLNQGRKQYGVYSRYVTEIIAAKAPKFEKASVDEFYIDLTGMEKYHNVLQWTIDLRKEIMDKTMLPISFGLASNKMVAKIATDAAKPNGYLYIPFGKEKEFLAPLPVNKIHGVGDSTYSELLQLGIEKIGDILKFSKKELEEKLGKYGVALYNKAQGIGSVTINNYREAKSVSAENTFNEDSTDEMFLLKELVRLTEKIGHELRDDGKMATSITVKIRYKGFDTFSKQTTIAASDFDHDFIPAAKKLFEQLYKKGTPVRLIGVRLANFVLPYQQADLFANKEKLNHLYKAIDDVKDKFGKKMLNRAGGT